MTKPCDLVVIGTGTAAMTAAMRVRAAGWRVAVIDHRPFGGTCALRGCDPKKMLIGGAEALDHAHRMQGHGVTGDVLIDWQQRMAFKRTFTDPVPEKMAQRYQDKDIDTYHGTARFLSEKSASSGRSVRRCARSARRWRRNRPGPAQAERVSAERDEPARVRGR